MEMKNSKNKVNIIDAFMEMVLNDENAPIEMKLDFGIMKAGTSIVKTLTRLNGEVSFKNDIAIDKKKECIEYLTMVNKGIQTYMHDSLGYRGDFNE